MVFSRGLCESKHHDESLYLAAFVSFCLCSSPLYHYRCIVSLPLRTFLTPSNHSEQDFSFNASSFSTSQWISIYKKARRVKIGKRMTLLHNMVLGYNQITGKAIMLDEIMEYVQSLQRQVEFLPMKLATINPRMEFNPNAVNRDVCMYI